MLSSTRAELDELMRNSQLSVMQYATPIMYVPGCATQLMKTANRARVDAGRRPLTTMSNVMSHFGRSLLQQQLDRTPYLDDLALPARHREGYLRCKQNQQSMWRNYHLIFF